MPETRPTGDEPATGAAGALHAGWREGLSIVNLRGDPGDARFLASAGAALGVALPTVAGGTSARGTSAGGLLRVVWAGPDDWFVIGPAGQAEALSHALCERLAGLHVAVTDVSSGYTVLRLAGPAAREALAQGCPLDLHPRVFAPGRCAGTHYFKAAVWLWQVDDEPTFEVLVRRSFMGYVALMLARTTPASGLVAR